jgi:hypothetical protein
MRRYLSTTVKTSGTTFTTGPNTTLIALRLQAGGGGGGGAATGVGTSAGAGGGAAGGYAEKRFPVTPNTTYTYAIGAAGAGGAAGWNDGSAGGNTTFAAGGVTVTANGGLGGKGASGSLSIISFLGGASPAISTNGDVNGGGEAGGIGLVLSAALAVSGKGGSCLFGSGGNSINVEGDGTAGTGNGAGGSGGMQDNAGTARAGGAGTAGIVVINEYASNSAQPTAPATVTSDWVKIAKATASSSASIDFTGLSSAYSAYKLVIGNALPATDATLFNLLTSTNGGAAYDVGASDYGWRVEANGITTDAADDSIQLFGTNTMGNVADESMSGEITITDHSAAKQCCVTWLMVGKNSAGTLTQAAGGGKRLTAADVDAIRLIYSSGNIASGVFTLYGLKA